MRLSADQESPDYSPEALYAKAYFNGAEITNCIMADEEQGYVTCLVFDEMGRIVINHSTNKPIVKTLHGNVRIELKK